MIVTVISECEKKAWKKTRRILSAYLIQRGRRTWMGHISEEGLGIIREKLIEASSKQMSVACFRHRGTKPPILEWFVGSRTSFSEEGVFSYRYKMSDLEYALSSDVVIKALSSIMSLAGFFHDNGKAIKGFQRNLALHNNGKAPELNAIRHEVISAIQLHPLMLEGGFSLISTPQKVREYFSAGMRSHYNAFIEQSVSYNESLAKAQLIENESSSISAVLKNTSPEIDNLVTVQHWEQKPLLQSLIYLVLTHHKLPGGSVAPLLKGVGPRAVSVEHMKPSLDVYFKQQPHPDIRGFLEITDNPPWMSDEWCEGVANAACRAMEAESQLSRGNILSSLEWSSAVLYLARPSLVLADYNASFNKQPCPIQNPEQVTYANTVKQDGKLVWADSLVDHQLKVGEIASTVYEHLGMRSHSVVKQAKYIKPQEKPPQLMSCDNPGEDSPFYWQYAISTKLKTMDIPGGFFGVLMSKTGAGKTKAAPQIMCSLSENTRFNIALGMRTLTMQTYKSYLSPLIGFTRKQVALMIGSGGIVETETNDLHGSANHHDNDRHDYDYVVNVEESPHPLMDSMLSPKQRKRLDTPVSVMTVDHLIQATSQQSGAHTTFLPEIMASDLILDEIDDYSPEDLVAISKLIFLTGFYGKKVILSSATSSNTMILALQESYLDGYSRYQSRYGAPDASIAYMSHEAPYLHHCSPSAAKATYRDFIANLCAKTQMAPSRHIAEIVNITKDSVWSDIFQSCRQFGERYYEIDNDTGIRVSIGFVRFNNTRNSSEFARYLLSSPDLNDTAIFVQNYHSKMDDATRYILESKMNTLLSRSVPGSFLKNADVRNAIETAQRQGKTKALIIVSTTSIQETGRDHDYDWAVVEPYSDKSLIQCAGRIWRHRRNKKADQGANLGIMSCPLNVFKKPDTCWSFPGVETFIEDKQHAVMGVEYKVNGTPAGLIKSTLDEIGITCSASGEKTHAEFALDVLATDLLTTGITAAPAISPITHYNNARMASIEQCKLHRLIGKNVAKQSLSEFGMSGFFNNGTVMLTHTHAQVRSFRKRIPGSADVIVAMKDPLTGFKSFNWDVSVDGQTRNFDLIEIPVNDPYERIFININQEEAVRLICADLDITDNEAAQKIASGSFTAFSVDKKSRILYSSFYGFDAE